VFSRGKHCERIVKPANNPTLLYLLEAGKQTSAAGADVGQDIFLFKICF
jgi:hypothetical protein